MWCQIFLLLLRVSFYLFYLFIFGCVGSWLRHAGSFIAARRLFIVVCGLLSSCGVWAPEHMGSVVVAYRLSNCCMQAKLLHSMWDLSSLTRDQTRVLCIGRWILFLFVCLFSLINSNLLFIYLFIYLFMAVLGLRFCVRAFSSCSKRGPLIIVVRGPLHYCSLSCCRAQAPDAQAQQLWLTGLVAPRHVGSSQTRAQTRVPCISRQILNHCATREAQEGGFLIIGPPGQSYPSTFSASVEMV